MKYVLAGLTSLFLIVTLGCGILGKKKIEEPDVELDSVEVQNAEINNATLLFIFKVKNPNDFELKVDGGTYNLETEGRMLAKGEVKNDLKVGPKTEAKLSLPAVVKYSDLFRSVSDLLKNGAIPYRLHGTARFGIIPIPFDEKGELLFENGKIKQNKK